MKEQASAFCLRIQAGDLICRHDLDLWLSIAKMDCAPDADGFPLDHGKSLIGRYRGSGWNESGKPLMGVFSSEIDKCGSQWASRHRDNPTSYLDFFADILNGFGVFYHYRLVCTRHSIAKKQSEKNCDEKPDPHCKRYILDCDRLLRGNIGSRQLQQLHFSAFLVMAINSFF